MIDHGWFCSIGGAGYNITMPVGLMNDAMTGFMLKAHISLDYYNTRTSPSRLSGFQPSQAAVYMQVFQAHGL